jgi:hypothetical protein
MVGTGRESASRIVLCLVWSAAILFGLWQAAAYSNSSAEVLPQASQWPADTRIALAADRPTMLVALHPRCVCSRATLEELGRLLAQTPTPIRVEILLYQPDNAPGSWAESDLTARARSMPGVFVRADSKGLEAERFGISVSGHTALYGPDGRLLFSGGITWARGHAGDNAGRSAILSILSKGQSATSRTPVFGCSIRQQG